MKAKNHLRLNNCAVRRNYSQHNFGRKSRNLISSNKIKTNRTLFNHKMTGTKTEGDPI